MAMFSSKKKPVDPEAVEAADAGAKKRKIVEAPVRVSIGFVPEASAKDAASIAKGFIVDRFDGKDTSWYAIAPFQRGFLYECHEGGNGVSYLPEIIEKLSADINQGVVVIPSGPRAFQIAMRDGRPLPMLLSEDESRPFMGGAHEFPQPTGKMKPAVLSGLAFVHVGSVIMAFGTIALFSSIAYFLFSSSAALVNRPIAYEQLPQKQWDSIRRVREDQYVNRLRYEDGAWKIDFADVPKTGQLPPVRPQVQPLPRPVPPVVPLTASPQVQPVPPAPVPPAGVVPAPPTTVVPVPVPVPGGAK